jgi:hypothetical protein
MKGGRDSAFLELLYSYGPVMGYNLSVILMEIWTGYVASDEEDDCDSDSKLLHLTLSKWSKGKRPVSNMLARVDSSPTVMSHRGQVRSQVSSSLQPIKKDSSIP